MSNKIKFFTENIVKSLIKQYVPLVGNAFTVYDDINSANESKEQNNRLNTLEKSIGELFEVSGIAFYLSQTIDNEIVLEELTKILNNDLIQYLNLDLGIECSIDDVVLDNNCIALNFMDTVESDIVKEELNTLVEGINMVFDDFDFNRVASIRGYSMY